MYLGTSEAIKFMTRFVYWYVSCLLRSVQLSVLVNILDNTNRIQINLHFSRNVGDMTIIYSWFLRYFYRKLIMFKFEGETF